MSLIFSWSRIQNFTNWVHSTRYSLITNRWVCSCTLLVTVYFARARGYLSACCAIRPGLGKTCTKGKESVFSSRRAVAEGKTKRWEIIRYRSELFKDLATVVLLFTKELLLFTFIQNFSKNKNSDVPDVYHSILNFCCWKIKAFIRKSKIHVSSPL